MKKIILLIIILVFITGCTAKYDVYLSKNFITESIDLQIDGNVYDFYSDNYGDAEYIEEEVLKDIPILRDNSKLYKKEINIQNNNTYVKLSGSYNYEDLKESYIINHCFESIYINNTDNYLDVSLKDFICNNIGNLSLNINSEYEIINSNSNNNTWNMKDIIDNGIEIRINKKEFKKNNGSFINTVSVILVIFFIITGTSLYIIKRNNE